MPSALMREQPASTSTWKRKSTENGGACLSNADVVCTNAGAPAPRKERARKTEVFVVKCAVCTDAGAAC